MAEFLVQELTALGASVEKRPIGSHTLEGQEVPLPPVVIAQFGTDPKKVRSISFVSVAAFAVPTLLSRSVLYLFLPMAC